MEALKNTTAWFLNPINYGLEVANRHCIETDKAIKVTEEGVAHTSTAAGVSNKESGKARASFLPQSIISIIALPIIALIGLFTIARALYQGESITPAFMELGRCGKELISSIPVSILGIFAPLSLTKSFNDKMHDCLFTKTGADAPVVDEVTAAATEAKTPEEDASPLAGAGTVLVEQVQTTTTVAVVQVPA